MIPLLSLLILLPVSGILLQSLLIRGAATKTAYKIPQTIFFLQILLSLCIYLFVLYPSPLLQGHKFYGLELHKWFTFNIAGNLSFNINYHLGVDGISLPFIILTGIVFSAATFIAKDIITQSRKAFYNLLLLTNLAIMGLFTALDLFLFFLSYELLLFPLFFLIAIWGAKNSWAAAVRFFLFSFTGSLLILLGIVLLAINVHPILLQDSFNLARIIDSQALLHSAMAMSAWPFLLFMLGFAVKVPLFPLHVWLPKAHTTAATPVSIILAGISLKVGVYGIIRFACGLFPTPAHNYSYYVIAVSLFTLLYASLNAYAAKDLKAVVAWSSVSHMGLAILALFTFTPEGLNATILYSICHGLLSILLFYMAHIFQDRAGTRQLDGLAALGQRMPVYATLATLAIFVGMGLPGFGVFISEFLVFLSLSKFLILHSLHLSYMLLLALGLLLGLLYWLRVLKKIFIGDLSHLDTSLYLPIQDLSLKERTIFIIVLLLLLLLGIFPGIIFAITKTYL